MKTIGVLAAFQGPIFPNVVLEKAENLIGEKVRETFVDDRFAC